MMNQHSGAATLPRGFRYSGHDIPTTPEPTSLDDDLQMPQIPPPPRPRLKLKRRVVSSALCAPTQQFLASVAAADVPIPSIEEPENEPRDLEMGGLIPFPNLIPDDYVTDTHLLQPRGRARSPPKTPAPPGFVPFLPPACYPSWNIDSALSSSIESTPDYESSRPSTSRSTQTSASLFSRISRLSEDDHCTNFEADVKDRYVLSPNEDVEIRPVKSKGTLRKAPWTKAMSDHLWSTFVLYLQDPKVTPFRMGKSCIPPHGVLLRVSREAKRSWRGSKALVKTPNVPNVGEGRKSGSSTPTAGNLSTFIQWPHTCSATRYHLRELCKLRAASGLKAHLLSRTPTPFSQAAARHWNRRSTPARNTSAFATQDMSVSLVVSTSDTMQPQGPLAQLTSSAPDRNGPPALMGPALGTFEGQPSFAERQRLGSPFGAKSYGPSSSASLVALSTGSPEPRRLSNTVGPRRTLQSPVRMSRSSTQKRRHTQSSEPRKRPTIGSEMWIDPNLASSPMVEGSRTAGLDSSSFNRFDEFLVSRIPDQPLSTSTSMPEVGGQLDAPDLPPPRLGSPFSGTNSSYSFPNRLHRGHQTGSVDLGMLGRPFATMHQYAEPSTPVARTSLAGRLAYIDHRLKELHRKNGRRRSESPL